jgi:hypothetical protein
MSWLRSADASMVWALELARIYLAVLGCVTAAVNLTQVAD